MNAAGFQTTIEFKLQLELKRHSDNIVQVVNVLVQRVGFLFDFACLAVKVGFFLPSVWGSGCLRSGSEAGCSFTIASHSRSPPVREHFPPKSGVSRTSDTVGLLDFLDFSHLPFPLVCIDWLKHGRSAFSRSRGVGVDSARKSCSWATDADGD